MAEPRESQPGIFIELPYHPDLALVKELGGFIARNNLSYRFVNTDLPENFSSDLEPEWLKVKDGAEAVPVITWEMVCQVSDVPKAERLMRALGRAHKARSSNVDLRDYLFFDEKDRLVGFKANKICALSQGVLNGTIIIRSSMADVNKIELFNLALTVSSQHTS